MKFCVDCKHFLHDHERQLLSGRCAKSPTDLDPQYVNWLIVGGKEPTHALFHYCSTERQRTIEGSCGVDAKLFEPKTNQPKENV